VKLRRVLTACFVVVPLGLGIGQPEAPSIRMFDGVGIDQKLNGEIPLELVFRDEEGKLVTLRDYFGSRPVILSLVYYNCPMLCTQILNGMVETFRVMKFAAGAEFDVVTVSIDPLESHELARMKKTEYLNAYGKPSAWKGWHFLTGNQASISALAEAVGFRYVYDEATKQFAHSSGITVATPEGKLARYLYGIEFLAKDLTFSLMEAANNKIGSPVDKLLLLCYHYDPMTGKYGLLVTNLLRAGGVLCVVLLGGYMAINFRRDRRQRQEPAA